MGFEWKNMMNVEGKCKYIIFIYLPNIGTYFRAQNIRTRNGMKRAGGNMRRMYGKVIYI